MTIPEATPTPPRRALFLLESRAALDAARMLPALVAAGTRRRPPDSAPHCIVVPGFGSGDAYTLPLRRFLKRQGFTAEGWGLGTNLAGTNLPHTQDDLSPRWHFERREDYRGEAGVPYLVDRLHDRVLARHRAVGRPIALIGWSLGGYLAREVARDLPEVVDRVITMGSPVVGGPKYTAVASLFARRGQDLEWIEAEIRRREAVPIRQPITAIFSRSDGIVAWQAALDRHSPRVRHVEVDAAHLGMGFNHRIWKEVLGALDGDGTRP
jgi:pimeloyl-ACP methyl ester carboxylesterase